MAFNLSQTLGIRGDAGKFMNSGNTFGRLLDTGGFLNPANTGLGMLLGVKGGAFGSQGGGGGGGYDSSGRPIQPAYTSQLESPTYTSMRSQYTSGSASPWANIATARQNNLAETQKQDLSQRNAGQTAGAMDKLAMTGGLTSGARERTVQGGQQNYMQGVQDIGNVQGKNLMQINLEDAKAKQELGKGLMTAEINDLMGRNTYNQGKYTADMAAWAAQQQANATRDAGGRDKFLGIF